MILYENSIGYVKGRKKKDGLWWIDELVIYPQYRGKGLARSLASHLPKKCKLLAYPLVNMPGPHLSEESLISFYESLGFVCIENNVMVREQIDDGSYSNNHSFTVHMGFI